jgi:hypothetical protein
MLWSGGPVLAQTADLTGVRSGDRWTYEVTDEQTGDLKQTSTVEVISVSDKEITSRVTTRGAAHPIQVVYDKSWNRLDDSIWKYRPSDGSGVPTPVEVGKSWRFDSKATHFQSDAAMRITGQSKVVGPTSNYDFLTGLDRMRPRPSSTRMRCPELPS